MNQDMVSFVLRFVREASEEQEARWRGIIKHVQSNNEAHFSQFSEAMEFMQSHVNEVVKTAFEESAEIKNPFLETAKLWGEYMPQYTKLMMETMKEAMNTPFTKSPMAEQMENAFLKTWSAWGLASNKEQEETAEQLDALLAQLAALQAKVQELESQLAAQQKKDE